MRSALTDIIKRRRIYYLCPHVYPIQKMIHEFFHCICICNYKNIYSLYILILLSEKGISGFPNNGILSN